MDWAPDIYESALLPHDSTPAIECSSSKRDVASLLADQHWPAWTSTMPTWPSQLSQPGGSSCWQAESSIRCERREASFGDKETSVSSHAYAPASVPRRRIKEEEKAWIRQYKVENPNATQEQIGEVFGVHRSTVSKMFKDARHGKGRNTRQGRINASDRCARLPRGAPATCVPSTTLTETAGGSHTALAATYTDCSGTAHGITDLATGSARQDRSMALRRTTTAQKAYKALAVVIGYVELQPGDFVDLQDGVMLGRLQGKLESQLRLSGAGNHSGS